MYGTKAIRIEGYDFEGPYTTTNELRDEAGVYVILDWRSDKRWHVIDVGESSGVKTRVENHDRKGCWTRHQQGVLGVAVYYTSGWTADQRRILEGRIRDSYNPPCGER